MTISTSRRRMLRVIGAAGGMALLGGRTRHLLAAEGDKQTVTRSGKALGTKVAMTVVHPSRSAGESALAAGFEELELVESLMSIYRPDSQISQLNRQGALDDPHPYLVEILRKSMEISQRSEGALDVTVQPLWELYSAAKKRGELPKPQEVQAVLPRIGWRKVEISDRRIRLKEQGMAITLNAIAQGYAADKVLAVLRKHGIEHALVDTGELGAMGRKADGGVWTIGIQHPRRPDAYLALAKLDNRCMATSGDYATSFTPDHLYNHIFNPKTGVSPRVFSSVTVVAPGGADADALATAIFVVGLESGQKLLEGTPSAEGLFVLKDGTAMATAGFPKA